MASNLIAVDICIQLYMHICTLYCTFMFEAEFPCQVFPCRKSRGLENDTKTLSEEKTSLFATPY